MEIEILLNAFTTLRSRLFSGRPIDPVVCRLRIPSKLGEVAWLWRDANRLGRNLAVNETFQLFLPYSQNVSVTWRPILEAEVKGSSDARWLAWWFVSQEPVVAGGTYESLDNFVGEAADWSLATGDFSIVRCGSYLTREGNREWRRPSEDAIGWVSDPNRCLVSEPLRQRVLRSLGEGLPTGENLTVRRFFSGATVAMSA